MINKKIIAAIFTLIYGLSINSWIILAENLNNTIDKVIKTKAQKNILLDKTKSSTKKEKTDDKNLSIRFSDFTYLFHTKNNIYYIDKLKSWFIYKLEFKKDIFHNLNSNKIKDKTIFYDRNNYNLKYFNSWKYIKYTDFIKEKDKYYRNNPETLKTKETNSKKLNLKPDSFSKSRAINQSIWLWKYNIDLKFKNIIWQIIWNSFWGYQFEDWNYIYYTNSNDSYKLYKIKKDWSELISWGTKVSNIKDIKVLFTEWYYIYVSGYYTRPWRKAFRINKNTLSSKEIISNFEQYNFHDWDYIYYGNSSDSWALYKIKKDGSESNTWWKKIIAKPSSRFWKIYDENYLYYNDFWENSKLYKLERNLPEIPLSWEKIINIKYPYKIFEEWDYIYYQNRNDNSRVYKANKNWSDINSWWTKFLNSRIEYNSAIYDGNYIYYLNSEDNNKIYKKYRYDSNLTWTKILDRPYSYFSSSDTENTHDENYIYYHGTSDWQIYRVKKDWSDVNSFWDKVTDTSQANISFQEWDYIYYNSFNYRNKLLKTKKDWNDNHLALDDWLYKSPEISAWKTLNNIKIDVNSTLPSWTNYDFYLANKSTEETLFEANESWVDFMPDAIMLFQDNFTNWTRQEILSKVNVWDKIFLDKDWNIWSFTVQSKDDWSIRFEYIPGQDLYEFRWARIYIWSSNFKKIDNSKLNWNTDLNLNNIFWLTTDKLYYKIDLAWDIYDTTKTPVINSVEFKESASLPVPENLVQEYQNSEMDNKLPIKPWEAIWKEQSWGKIILGASIQNTTWEKLRLEFSISWPSKWSCIYTSYNTESFHEWFMHYQWPWNYSWKVRTQNENWDTSEWIDFEWETDFSLFEGFEPYPYGYNFYNNSIANWVLTWKSIKIKESKKFFFFDNTTIFDWDILNWTRWNIFKKSFDIDSLTDVEMLRAFESLWLNKDSKFQGGNCFWMAASAAMLYVYPDYFKKHYPDFYEKVEAWTLREKIESPSLENDDWSNKINGIWDFYTIDKTLEVILSFQLAFDSGHYKKEYSENKKYLIDIDDIPNTIKDNPDKTYILAFYWDGWGHAVIPYKVETIENWNRIYIWDNNVPYPDRRERNAYNQYIDINSDWTFVSSHSFYNNLEWFTKMSLMDVEHLYYNQKKWIPDWFWESDLKFAFSWKSDLLIKDSNWRKSWFQNWEILEEIPWVEVIIPINISINWNTENKWKEIYLPENQDNLTIEITWKDSESYDLMVAWWNSYTKIESVETTEWEIDTFNINKSNIKINFDDNKTWEYNILIDNFYNGWTWEITEKNILSDIKPQQYNIDWWKVYNNEFNSITYEIDKNLDWIYEDYTYLLPTSSPAVLITSPSLDTDSTKIEKSSKENKKEK